MRSDTRGHELFLRHPEGTLTLSSGRCFMMPFHCYDADCFVVTGTVDLPELETLLQGEGCYPTILRRQGGPDQGVAQIWLNIYRDTNFGPYRGLVISFAASSEKDTLVFPYRSPASLLLPSVDSRSVVFARWLYLDSQPGIDAGREVFGFPKYRAELSYDRVPSGDVKTAPCTTLTHRTMTADGKEVLRFHLTLGRAIRKRLEMSWELLRTLGARKIVRMGRAGEVASTMLTPTLLKQAVTPVRAVGRSRLYPWIAECELSFGPDTAGGRALAGLRFDPVLIQVIPALKFVMLADDPRTADSITAANDVG